jgi:malonyl-CoA/methylmalonyl-CoA synthetase
LFTAKITHLYFSTLALSLTMTANIYTHLRAGFRQAISAIAVETIDANSTPLCYTWSDLEQGSAMLANALRSFGVRTGNRVAVQTHKSVEAMMLYLATLRLGAVFVPLNTAYQAGEMAHFISDSKPTVVVCDAANEAWLKPLCDAHGVAQLLTLNANRTGSLLVAATLEAKTFKTVARKPDDIAAILYTSGTTGRSKGALLSHNNLLSNAQTLKTHWGWRANDVLIHVLPIFHVHGLFVAIHGALLAGAKMLWAAKFEPARVLANFPRATVFMGVPTLYVRLLAESGLNPAAVKHMRVFIAGSAPLLAETFKDWQTRTGHTIVERYGMSETVMLTSNPYHGKPQARRAGTVGLPLPGVLVRVVDDVGRPLAQGEIGNIVVKGPNVFAAYLNLPEKTIEEFTVDGFFKTGDVGSYSADGYLSIVGRSKDLIISGGYNVYPAEIESIINEMPGVAESALVGVPHPDFGEVGVALVIAKASATLCAETVIAQLKALVANFKVPKHCVLMAELPRNAMGKVQKNLLREQYSQLFIKKT